MNKQVGVFHCWRWVLIAFLAFSPLWMAPGAAAAQAGRAWDDAFYLNGFDHYVHALLAGPAGIMYAGGEFALAENVVARRAAAWNGHAWTALDGGFDDDVRALAADGATLYAGGMFGQAGAATAHKVARWNGSSWHAMGDGLSSTVYALAVGAGGSLYAGGAFSNAGGDIYADYLARWNGTNWASVGGTVPLNGAVYALATHDNDVYVGGSFQDAGGVAQADRVARWDGTAWSAMGTGLSGTVRALAVDDAGNVYAAGEFVKTGDNVTTLNRIARWNPDTNTWSPLGNGFGATVYALALDAGSGDLYAGGNFLNAGGDANADRVARWHGGSWLAIGTGLSGAVHALAVDTATGCLNAGGLFTDAGGDAAADYMARWCGSSWGRVSELPAGPGLNDDVHTLTYHPGTAALYAGGYFTDAGSELNADHIARWDGNAWHPLGGGLNGDVLAIAPDGNGGLYVGGLFTDAGGNPNADHLARWDGANWSAVSTTGLNNGVRALAFHEGMLYVGGSFTDAGGLAYADKIARWDPATGTWSALGSGIPVGNVHAIIADGSTIYVGGGFSGVGGDPNIDNIARWDGTSWSALGAGLGNSVNALALDGHTLYAGGVFSGVGGSSDDGHVARWNGTNWSPVGNGLDGIVHALAFDPAAGHLYAGGSVWYYGPNHVAMWDGSVWSSLGAGLDGIVQALAIDAAGGLYAGGQFQTSSDLVTQHIAHWTTPPAASLQLTAFEVTQAIQDLNHSVDLFEGKRTFVRVHVQPVGGYLPGASAVLIGRRNGVELPGSPLALANYGGRVDVPVDPDRHLIAHSFLFELPDDWISGDVELEVQGLTVDIACDPDCTFTAIFHQPPAAHVRLMRIAYWTPDGYVQPSEQEILRAVQELEALYPIGDLTWNLGRVLYLNPVVGNPDNQPDYLRINARLSRMAAADPTGTFYLGLIGGTPSGLAGMAAGIPCRAAAAYLTGDHVLSHEFAHCLGRMHVDCGNHPWGVDPFFPNPNGWISPAEDGPAAAFGFDTRAEQFGPTSVMIQGPRTCDLMSGSGWISPYTSDGIETYLRAWGTLHGWESWQAPAAPGTGTDYTIVSGVITSTLPTARLDPLLTVNLASTVLAPVPGAYTIRFEDASGSQLAAYPFDPAQPEYEGTGQAFALTLPWNPAAHRVVLLSGAQELASRTASANAPAVQVSYPNGGEDLGSGTATIQWAGEDVDGDALAYTLQYSRDGGATWDTLALDLTATSYDLDLATVPGTAAGLIRVLATDGLLTAQDQSDGSFTVDSHAPSVTIDAPGDDSLYVGEQALYLAGTGYDLEDGALTGAALTWSSDLDGTLGTGEALAVNAGNLAEGEHVLTLTTQDGDGQTATATIRVRVYRVLAILPPYLDTAPGSLRFVVEEGQQAGEGQGLWIDNLGDGILAWAIDADQSWIDVTPLAGVAPGEALVTVDAAGLAPGEYAGQVTIAAVGASNSPRVVPVALTVTRSSLSTVYLPLVLRNSR